METRQLDPTIEPPNESRDGLSQSRSFEPEQAETIIEPI